MVAGKYSNRPQGKGAFTGYPFTVAAGLCLGRNIGAALESPPIPIDLTLRNKQVAQRECLFLSFVLIYPVPA